ERPPATFTSSFTACLESSTSLKEVAICRDGCRSGRMPCGGQAFLLTAQTSEIRRCNSFERERWTRVNAAIHVCLELLACQNLMHMHMHEILAASGLPSWTSS